MGCVIHSAQSVRHGMNDSKAYIGEAHAGDILPQRHALTALLCILTSSS